MKEDTIEKSYRFKDPTNLNTILIFAIYIFTAISIILIASSITQHILLLDLKNGASFAKQALMANYFGQELISFLRFIIFIIFGISYFVWLYRIVNNALSFHPKNISMTPAKAIIWYFIPFVCFIWPYQDMRNLWKISLNPDNWERMPSSTLVKWWWWLFLIGSIFIYRPINLDGAEDIDLYIAKSFIGILGLITYTISNVLLTYIIKAICKYQIHTYNSLKAAASNIAINTE